eukprot:10169053-Heterocapsa_arctica.AAC.1
MADRWTRLMSVPSDTGTATPSQENERGGNGGLPPSGKTPALSRLRGPSRDAYFGVGRAKPAADPDFELPIP